MFQHLLLPLDLTNRHGRAIEMAIDLARHHNGRVTLLHVIESIAGWADEEVDEFYKRIEKSAQEHLDRYGATLDERGIPWHARVITGNRVEEIAKYAEDNAVDLIILSAPRIDPENPSGGWASLSWKVSFLAPCPVLLVK